MPRISDQSTPGASSSAKCYTSTCLPTITRATVWRTIPVGASPGARAYGTEKTCQPGQQVFTALSFPSTGPPSEDHCYSDIEAAYDYLRSVLRIPARNIVLYGRSLGSGPSCHLAVKTGNRPKDEEASPNDGPVGGLILHAPFLSVYRVVIDTGCTLPGDKFPNVDLLSMVKSPTILVHGTSDQIVPFHHSERLHETLPKEFRARPIFIEGMSHNNVHAQVRPLFCDRLAEFLEDSVWPKAMIKGRAVQQVTKARSKIWKMVEHECEYEDEMPKVVGL